ncbi:M16 family metallopeptidase [Aestuariibaculum marinum]|uniref:Insulinase family protein n=1 Tax=Aestuariibaculum marinum TaxID=2683592 RepID=A0A8J6Q758_9FLAO|nr:pitrilysin family protein [Aestuariibaculum marinum]MBD0825474.1 insulinase family protein [Aestuariibaculum marinum]
MNFKYIVFICIALVVTKVNSQNRVEKFEKIQELEGVEEYLYTPNGMKMLLVQDNSAPVVTVQVVYRVGSKHEVPGNTGSTHLLEHLNFKGTPTFNKKNGTGIFKILQGIGAEMNATTWNDRTNYYETIPSDKIELALHIEADRMRNSLLLKEDKEAEMTVVRNEFERGENNPGSLLSKEIWATAYMAHPYHHETIGWRSDIEKMPIEVLRDFYNTYYWPDNATLTIIGDFQKDQLFGLVDKYFGAITKAPHQIPQPYTTEPEQLGPRRIVVKKPGQQAMVTIAYKIPGRMHEDLPALEVLSQIAGSGTSSLISKTFVDKGLATFGYARASKFQDVGLFTVTLAFSPDKDVEELNAQLINMLDKIKEEGVTQEDVDRVVAKLNTQTILSRDGSGSIASELNEAIAGGDWRDYIKGAQRLSKVTAEDVKRVANKYLLENQSTTGYFIPEEIGSNTATESKASGVKSENWGKYYFRNPQVGHDHLECDNILKVEQFQEITSAYETIRPTAKGEKYIRKEISGIDVVTVKTGAKGFVTVAASFPISSYIGTGSEVVPTLTVNMLSKGTKLNNKFEFSEKLEKLGATIRISSDVNNINIRFKCLTQDVDNIVALLAEELRQPLFDPNEFKLLKEQSINNMKNGLTDPGTQGSIALSQAIYPKGHPNYESDIETTIKQIEAATIDDLKAFHRKYFGTAGMHLVAVGDIDTKNLYGALKTNFSRWNGGTSGKGMFNEPSTANALTEVVTIPKKPSAELFIGKYTGIERNDDDYIPFFIGNTVLGGGFSGRLMQTVRDRDGLTYGIYAGHTGHNMAGGFWSVNASFNPSLFQKGLDATMIEIKNWIENGITKEELEHCKNNITGSFKVGMATTSGLSSTLLSFLQSGKTPEYLDQYPKDVEAVTLLQVNQAIKKYVDLDKLTIIKSGSLNQQGEPLE